MSEDTSPELREICAEECRVLMASSAVGRFATIGTNGAPHVVPVNYVSDGRFIVFRSNDGVKLRASRDRLVTFQIDHVDLYRRCGWSVMAHGTLCDAAATLGADTRHGRAISDLVPDPWVISDGDVSVITITHITGRRIVIHEDPRDPRGYL